MKGTHHPSRVSSSTQRAGREDVKTKATDSRARAEQRKQREQQQKSEAEQVGKADEYDKKKVGKNSSR